MATFVSFNRRDPGGLRPDLTFHSEMSVAVNEKQDVTEHPIAGDTPIADHIQRRFRSLTIVVCQTETPGPWQIPASNVVEDGRTYLEEAIEWLESYRTSELVYISDRGGVFSQIAIESYGYEWDSVARLVFTIQAKQIRRAREERVRLPPPRPRGKPKPDLTPSVDTGDTGTPPAFKIISGVARLGDAAAEALGMPGLRIGGYVNGLIDGEQTTVRTRPAILGEFETSATPLTRDIRAERAAQLSAESARSGFSPAGEALFSQEIP